MSRMTSKSRSVGLVLAFALALQSVAVGPASAGMIATESLTAERVHLAAQLDRQAVRDALATHGVTIEEARSRVAALSDSEVAELSVRIQEDPAGQGLGLVLTAGLIALIILVVADATDHTDVF